MLRRVNFYLRLRSSGLTFLHNVLWSSLRLNCSDWILLCVCYGHSKYEIMHQIFDDWLL